MSEEMPPIIDKPTIQYIIEEDVALGIEEILIVTGKSNLAIKDYFDCFIELGID
jgi:UTP--glucose-1-phosphate uridylyltransferase